MLGYAILLTVYHQAADSSIEIKTTLVASNKLCLEQGRQAVDSMLSDEPKDGKPLQSVWFSCQPVRGKTSNGGNTKAPGLYVPSPPNGSDQAR